MKMWFRLKMEEFWIWLASITPKPVVYYCGVRLVQNALKDRQYKWLDGNLSAQEVLARWNKK